MSLVELVILAAIAFAILGGVVIAVLLLGNRQ